MKILLASLELESLTGQPMYTYNLAKGLSELGNDVTCVANRIGGAVTKWLEELGIPVYKSYYTDEWFDTYDLVIISEYLPDIINNVICDDIYNLCHSKSYLDRPIDRDEIKGYLAPRQEILDHHGIKGQIMPIPINTSHFKPYRGSKKDGYLIVAPCTQEELRKPMLLDLIKRATGDTKVWIIGKDYGALKGVEIPENVKIYPETDNIYEYMKYADEVAGIFIGTVTLEAWAMGIKTSVYDEKGNWKYIKGDIKNNDYKAVAKKFIKLYEG